MKDKLTKSEVRDRKKKFPKSRARDVQKKNKEAFDKSYFGGVLQENKMKPFK